MLGLDPSISLSARVAEMLNISGLCAATDARVRPEHVEERPAADKEGPAANPSSIDYVNLNH